MIIKSKSRRRATWRQLLNYMEQGTDDRSIVLTRNLRGNTIEEWMREYSKAEELRINHRKDQVMLYHEVMSFHDLDLDAVTPEKLKDMTREYINLRAERGLVVAMSHHDRQHVHVHFCVSGVEHSTGKSMRMSRSQFTAIKRTMQVYQQHRYPELAHSIADHGRKAREVRSDKEYLMKQRTGKSSSREEVAAQLRVLFDRSMTLERFDRALKEQGMEVYLRSGRPQGVRVGSIKYRFSSIGIAREELTRSAEAPSRMEQLARIRERRRGKEQEREVPLRERTPRSPAKALGEPTQNEN